MANTAAGGALNLAYRGQRRLQRDIMLDLNLEG